MEPLILTHRQCELAAQKIAERHYAERKAPVSRIYGVPRGGVPVAYLVARSLPSSEVANTLADADVIVDDIVDSGTTRRRVTALRPNVPFYSLVDFLEPGEGPAKGQWVVFPWENKNGTAGDEDGDPVIGSAEDIVLRLLQFIGEDFRREGLQETPRRVMKAWKEWTAGYSQSAASVLKTFKDGGETYDEMVMVRDLPFYSHCEHHLAPFFGTATIAYIPNQRIVGLSKLGRLLEVFARRLQVQERMTAQIADALQDALMPRGVAVLVRARHLCMESRGLSRQGHQTITTALRGLFLDRECKAREEFLSMAK